MAESKYKKFLSHEYANIAIERQSNNRLLEEMMAINFRIMKMYGIKDLPHSYYLHRGHPCNT